MKKFIVSAVLVLLVLSLLPTIAVTHAQSAPQVTVKSQYIVNRYGWAVVNETVTFRNNGTASIAAPSLQLGLGNVTSKVVSYNVTAGYSAAPSSTGNQSTYTITNSGVTVPPSNSTSFSFKALVNGIVSTKNQNLSVLLVTRPFFDLQVKTMTLVIDMPSLTSFNNPPTGFKRVSTGSNATYTRLLNNTQSLPALNQVSEILTSSSQDFHPLNVFYASRTITVSGTGDPVVQDSLHFVNLGDTQMTSLTIAPLTTPGSTITVLSTVQPPLLVQTNVALSGFGIDLTNPALGVPVDPGANYTITYSYPLAKQLYNSTGGAVNILLPKSPPIGTFVDTYTISVSAAPGVRVSQGGPITLSNVSPVQSGKVRMSYGLAVGWALDGAVPVAAMLFVILLVGLFVLKGGTTAEEETEETASELTSAMVKAFEEKTSLINSLFDEVPTKDPNTLNKTYFDELRSRLDTFRSRALQRLNEVKQKSATKKFFDLLNQMHATEREVDRAAKDMLNLYEQFYTKRMRKEVFDKLLPSYRKRLDRALNQLSDELNIAQRESKLL